MLKRFSALLLALAWALMLSACGYADVQAGFVFTDETASAPAVEPTLPDPVFYEVNSQQPESEPPAETEQAEPQTPEAQPPESEAPAVDEDGWYSSKEEVALYIHLYGHLPDNYLTKREAEALGWSGGSVERYAGEGTAIGGSRFGNYEGLLPEKQGRAYTECDIGTVGSSSRGAERVVFSNDGLVYYTGDHYQSFELLYGEP